MGIVTRVAYAAPSIGLAGLSLPLLVYLPNYYATGAALPLATVGGCFLAARLIDILFDPLVGGAMDRMRTRFGRFRPWLVVGTPALVFFTWLLFNPTPGGGAGRLILTLFGLYAAWSVCFVAQLGWGCALSSDYRERNAIFTWWQGLYLLGSLLVTAIPMIPAYRGAGATAIHAMGLFVMVAVPVGVVIAVALVPEPATPPTPRPSFGDCLRLIARPTIARLLAIDLLLGIAVMLGGSLFFFYFGVRHGIDRGGAAILFFFLNLGSFAGVWLWGALGSRLGKHRAATIAFAAYATMLALIQILPVGSVAIAAPVILLFGATVPAGPVLIRSMLGDAGDEEELRTGHDHTGLIAALFANSSKLGTALGPAIGFIGLGAAGFQPNADAQQPAAIWTLYLLATGIPALLGLLCAWLARGHRITPEVHAKLVDALHSRRAAEDGHPPHTMVSTTETQS